jgi:hypothetical protein
MPARGEEVAAVRREIIDLLREQMDPQVPGPPETTSCGAQPLVSTETAVRI